MKILLILSLFISTSFKIDNKNRKEYNKTVLRLIENIQALKDYQIDAINGNWRAKSRNGFYSFEGSTDRNNGIDDYIITIKSIIYSAEYFEKQPSFKVPFYIYRTNDDIDTSVLIINTASESFESSLPFEIKDIEVAYMEKVIGLPYSEEIVFNRMSFKEVYIVLFKNKSIKKYYVDPVSRKYQEE